MKPYVKESSSNVLSPVSRRRALARLQRPEPRTRLAVRGVSEGALRTHSSQQDPLWGGLITCRVLFARAPVLGLCFYISVNRVKGEPEPSNSRISSQCMCTRVLRMYALSMNRAK